VAAAALVDESGGGNHADGPEEPGAQLHAQERQVHEEGPECCKGRMQQFADAIANVPHRPY
jgi:hypothetical protein